MKEIQWDKIPLIIKIVAIVLLSPITYVVITINMIKDTIIKHYKDLG